MITIKFKENGVVKEGKVDKHTFDHINGHSHIEVIVAGAFQLVAVANVILNS